MSEGLQIVLGIVFLAVVYIATRAGVIWRLRRTSQQIVNDLHHRGASDEDSAVELSYAKTDWLKFGLRDYRPKALEGLVQSGVVGRTPTGRFYLVQHHRPVE